MKRCQIKHIKMILNLGKITTKEKSQKETAPGSVEDFQDHGVANAFFDREVNYVH